MILPNKLFDKNDYKDEHFSEIKQSLETIYKFCVDNEIEFEYSDWNRAWEYSQLTYQTNPFEKKVLDVGSGKSLFPVILSKLYRSFVTSVDVEDVLERYKLYYNTQQQIDIVKADARDLPFKHELFDMVYMASVIEHIPDFWIAISEAVRVCKSGGFIALTTDYTHDQSTIKSHKSGKTYDKAGIDNFIKTLRDRNIPVLLESKVDYSVDLTNPDNRAVKGEYTFISLIFKRI